MDKITAIILNWQQPDLTIKTVDSCLKSKSSIFKLNILIVDNGSTDDSLTQFKKKYKSNSDIEIISSKENLGFASGNNFGINHVLRQNPDYILIANNDLQFSPDFLIKLYSKIKKNPKSIVIPKIYFAPGFEYHQHRYQKKDQGKVIWAMGGEIDWQNIYGSNIYIDKVDLGLFDESKIKPDFASGCCFLVSQNFFKDVGLFDSRYFLYLEDVELSLRAKNKGYNITPEFDSKIWHYNSGSTKAGSVIHDYYLTRNRLLFAFSYASLKTQFAIFRESITMLFSGRPWQKRGVIDYYLRRFGQGSFK